MKLVFSSDAEPVGHASEAAFSRAFKKIAGEPPAAWRRSLQDALRIRAVRGLDGRDDEAAGRGQQDKVSHTTPPGLNGDPQPPTAQGSTAKPSRNS